MSLSTEKLGEAVNSASTLAGNAQGNTRTCAALAKILSTALKQIKEATSSGAEDNSTYISPTQSKHRKRLGSFRVAHVPPNLRPFYKVVFDVKKWIATYTKQNCRMSRRTLQSLSNQINNALADAANAIKTKLHTVSDSALETCWEDDVLHYMEKHNWVCLVLYIDEPSEDADEKYLGHLDSEHVALFRITADNLAEKLARYNTLDDFKFDGRIRIVINTKDPKSVMNVLKETWMKDIPIMVNTGGLKGQFEAAIQELVSLRSDVIISARNADFENYCSFSTLLWVGEGGGRELMRASRSKADKRQSSEEDGSAEQRKMVAKRALKSGVVTVKTPSIEKGLRYLETHGFLGKITNFRVIIGDTKSAGEQGRGKGDQLTSAELVEILRNRLKWNCPILVYYGDKKNVNLQIYDYRYVKLTVDLQEAVEFASMKSLSWAPDLSAFNPDTNGNASSKPKKGTLKITGIRCNGLAAKDSNGLSDPYAIIRMGETKIKTNYIRYTLDPVWEIPSPGFYSFPCKLGDKISFEVWDWDLLTASDFEGMAEFELTSYFPFPLPYVEVTRRLVARKDSDKVGGTITIEMSYTADEEDEKALVRQQQAPVGLHFGRPLDESLSVSEQAMHLHIIEKAIAYIRSKSLKTEGVFRLPGHNPRILELKKKADAGEDIVLDSEDDYDVSSFIKLYFRELPDPLIPSSMFDDFRKGRELEERHERVAYFAKLFQKLPEQNRDVLIDIVHLLSEIAEHESVNKMPARNLATCLAPTLIIPATFNASPVTVLSETKFVTDLFEFVIVNHDDVFKEFIEAHDAKAATSPRKKMRAKKSAKAKPRKKKRTEPKTPRSRSQSTASNDVGDVAEDLEATKLGDSEALNLDLKELEEDEELKRLEAELAEAEAQEAAAQDQAAVAASLPDDDGFDPSAVDDD